ncbi:MAG: hypothetical protein ACJA0N_001767 [Pseudohongiellaceae bacterium]|jgi:hypothetical protein
MLAAGDFELSFGFTLRLWGSQGLPALITGSENNGHNTESMIKLAECA